MDVSIHKTSGLRPYEKCEALGADSLSDAELIAVMIRSGSRGKSAVELAEEILLGDGKTSAGLNRLMQLDADELTKFKGIGRVKSIQISCLCELAKRIARQQAVSGLSADSPKTVAGFYMGELRFKPAEEVHLMLLNSKNRMLKSVMISRGTVNSSQVSPREVFLSALKYKAASMILIHNHPSGDPNPSEEDICFSRQLYKLGILMNIPLRDSIIIGDNIYTSFLEKGLLYIDE